MKITCYEFSNKSAECSQFIRIGLKLLKRTESSKTIRAWDEALASIAESTFEKKLQRHLYCLIHMQETLIFYLILFHFIFQIAFEILLLNNI